MSDIKKKNTVTDSDVEVPTPVAIRGDESMERNVVGKEDIASGTTDIYKHQSEPRQCCGPGMKWIVATIISLAILGVILGLIIPIILEENETPPDEYEQEYLLYLLSLVSPSQALVNPGTPQYSAYQWLAYNNSNLELYSDERKIQRYSLATLYYSTNGDEWENNTGWLSDRNECEWWSGDSLGEICSSNGAIVKLDLRENNLVGKIPVEISLLADSIGTSLCCLMNGMYHVCFP